MRGQGRIYQRGPVWWIAYYHRGHELRESAKTTNRRKAENLLRERQRTAGRPDFIGPAAERVTFDDLGALYLTLPGQPDARCARHSQRRAAATTFGRRRALDITADRVAGYVERRLADGAQADHQPRAGGAPPHVLARREGAKGSRYRPHIAMLAEDNAREGFLEPADFERARASPADLADAATFAYLTGWRKGEVKQPWSGATSMIAGGACGRSACRRTARTSGRRLVALRGELLELLQRRACAVRRSTAPASSIATGSPLGDFRKAWRRPAKAGASGRLFHDMRRSAASATWCAPASRSASRWRSAGTGRAASSTATTSRPRPTSPPPSSGRPPTSPSGGARNPASARFRTILGQTTRASVQLAVQVPDLRVARGGIEPPTP